MLAEPRKTVWQALRDLVTHRKPKLSVRLEQFVNHSFPVVTLPLTVLFVFRDRDIRPEYGMTWPRLFRLAWRLYRNTTRVIAGTSYRAHLVMLAKLLEIPPDVEGVVVECGCYQGGATTNLSIICDVVGRDFIVYDSFEGLPGYVPGDKIAVPFSKGVLTGTLEQVRSNVGRYGVIERCTFRKGWFADTLPKHTEPIVLVFIDVDLQSSIHDCLVNLWPYLTDEGYFFTDDFPLLDLCAVFFSEEFWSREFDRPPPGLIGSGTGVALGQYWVGPFERIGGNPAYPLQTVSSIAYTRKDFTGHWGYVPAPAEPPAPAGTPAPA